MKDTKKKFDVIDLFAGAGGLSNGFEQTEQFEVKYAVELNKAAQQTYLYNHDNKNLLLTAEDSGLSDITQINFKNLNLDSDKTVVIGGPPCQGFSNANRQKNYLISGNNQLVKEYVRVIRDVRPIAFLMENVKSMNSSVHKFFVTESLREGEDDFSSEKHLTLINKKNSKPLYNQDSIELLITDNEDLTNIMFNFSSIKEVPSPFIIDPLLITRLRTIERKINRQTNVELKKRKEQKEIDEVLKSMKKILDDGVEAFKLLDVALNALEKLKKEVCSADELQKNLLPFIEFNRFLTRCQELNKEGIACGEIVKEKNDTGQMVFQVPVKSYNVVKYLECIFDFYGYKIDSGVLDASEFGVPQRRKRFIMLGVRELNEGIKLPKGTAEKSSNVKEAIGDLEDIPVQFDVEGYNPDVYPQNIKYCSTLTSYYREKIISKVLYNHISTNSTERSKERFEAINKTGGKNFHSLPEDLKKGYADASRTQNTVYLRLNYEEPSPTVVNVRKSMWQHPTLARALSIREAARLQSFQDKFEFKGRKDEQYQQIGNAVPPLLAKALATHLLEYLNEEILVKN